MSFFMKQKFCDKAVIYLKQITPPNERNNEELLTLDENNCPIYEYFSDDCVINYLIYDKKIKAFQYVLKRHSEEDGYTKEDLKEIGLKNLDILSNKMMKVEKLSGFNVYQVFLDNNFEASLILLEKLWDYNFKKYIQNSYMVAIPARHILFFCDSEDKNAVKNLALVCEIAMRDEDHLLSKYLYLRKQGEWLPCEYSIEY